MIKNIPVPPHDIVYGINPVCELLRAKKRKIYTLYTARPLPKGWSKIEALLAQRKIPITYIDRNSLTRMAQTADHQGVVCMVQPFSFRKTLFNSRKHPFIVLLDGIQDARNLGAILRSAFCTGVDGVILTKKNSAPLNAVAFKGSAGYAEHLEIYQAASTISAVTELRQAGYTIYIAGFGGEDACSVTYAPGSCIVIGSEGSGVSPAVYSLGKVVTLAQRIPEVSYNASVAAGIFLFNIAKNISKI